MKTKVGMFVNFFSLIKGGAEIYTAEFSRALKNLGYDISIITAKSFFKDSNPIIDDFPIVYRPSLFELREFSRLVPGKVGYILYLIQSYYYKYQIQKCITQWNIIHTHGYDTASIALKCRKQNQPVILTLHGPPSTTKIGGKIVARILTNVDAVVALSEHIYAMVKRYTNANCYLIPGGIDLKYFRPKNKTLSKKLLGFHSKYVILYVGRLISIKNLDILLKSFAQVIQKMSDIMLVIVGGGVLENHLKHLAKSLKIDKFTRFDGTVEHKKLVDYYNASDIVVLPSKYENFPLIVIETLACGTQVIVSDKIVEPIRLFPQIKKANFRSPDDFANKIISSLTMNNQSISQERLREFDWSNIAKKYDELYRLCLQRRKEVYKSDNINLNKM